tara:strand:+ start:11 stop:748 length:738 start_codon:yes stop_codon:yes gene_type:complete
MKKINILYSLIIFFLITVIINNNHIFKKTFKIIKKESYSKRIENTYGYCKGSSVGYLRFIKEKFKLNINPKIINFAITPPLDWSIYDLNLNKDESKIILLNYKKDFNYIFTKQKINSWVFKDIIQNTKSINKIKFKTVNNDDTFLNGTLNLYKINSNWKYSSGKKDLIYKKKINQIVNSNPIIIDFKTKKFNSYFGSFLIEFENLKNNNLDNIQSIILNSNNYINIENYKIINQDKDCYYVSSRN